MRLPPKISKREIAQVNASSTNMRSRAYKAAEKREGLISVCLCGPSSPIPRRMGDNMGGWPVFLIVTVKDRTAAKDDDLSQPYHRFDVLELVKVETREHGERLKHALDVMLLGAQQGQDNDQPRHKFRDVMGCFETAEDRHAWWAILVEDAHREVMKQATRFPIYSPETAVKKVAAAARSFGRGARR